MSLDISVSHLNNRLALQLPTELPLGLVFVVGVVHDLRREKVVTDNGRSTVFRFHLTEGEHSLPCQLTPRATAEIRLREGDKIRAGGHLVFNSQQASYRLLARDVEVINSDDLAGEIEPEEPVSTTSLPPRPHRTALSPLLADIKKRAELSQMTQADLPPWVQQMAPPEVRTEETEDKTADDNEGAGSTSDAPPSDAALSQELIAFLSAAMEDLEEVEVTSTLLDEMAPDEKKRSPPPAGAASGAYEVPPPASSTEETAVSPQRPPQERDNATIWLLASLIVLALVILLAIFLFL